MAHNMIVTEEEAKGKWCPKARAPQELDDGNVSINRNYEGRPDRDCMCLSSLCMWWVFVDADERKPNRKGCCGVVVR